MANQEPFSTMCRLWCLLRIAMGQHGRVTITDHCWLFMPFIFILTETFSLFHIPWIQQVAIFIRNPFWVWIKGTFDIYIFYQFICFWHSQSFQKVKSNFASSIDMEVRLNYKREESHMMMFCGLVEDANDDAETCWNVFLIITKSIQHLTKSYLVWSHWPKFKKDTPL